MKIAPLILLLLLAAPPSRGQAPNASLSTPDVAGEGKKISGIIHEYAIGQVLAGDASIYGGMIITPGLLQPAPRSRFSPEKTIAASELQVFPNPAENAIFLQPAFRRGGTLEYALFDVSGKLIMGKKSVLFNGTEKQDLDVRHITVGQYFLRVTWTAGRATPRTSGYKIQKLRWNSK